MRSLFARALLALETAGDGLDEALARVHRGHGGEDDEERVCDNFGCAATRASMQYARAIAHELREEGQRAAGGRQRELRQKLGDEGLVDRELAELREIEREEATA